MTPELQAKFQQRLKDLTENAQKKKNVLEYQEVVDAFTDLNLQPEDVEKVYDHLENAGIDVIGLIEEVPDDKEDLDLTLPENIRIDDPVRMYLKEIGKVHWLKQTFVWWSVSQNGMSDVACSFWI